MTKTINQLRFIESKHKTIHHNSMQSDQQNPNHDSRFQSQNLSTQSRKKTERKTKHPGLIRTHQNTENRISESEFPEADCSSGRTTQESKFYILTRKKKPNYDY